MLKITQHKAKIRIAEKPMKIIRWFTNHFDHEIGALGIGEIQNGELLVEKLAFPKQIVNGSHVHFKPSDWGPIVKDMTMEELSKVIFYWHKHPDNSPSASQGDEDDTFDVFMDESSQRPFFGFLQTARKTGGGMAYEGRIEMRTPIKASILNVELVTDENDGIKTECEEIIKESVSFGHASASDQPGFKKEKVKDDGYDYSFEKDDYDSFFKVFKKSGCVKIEASLQFEEYVLSTLECSVLTDTYTDVNCTYNKDNLVTITIRPKKKQINHIYKFFKDFQNEMFYGEEEPIKDIGTKTTDWNGKSGWDDFDWESPENQYLKEHFGIATYKNKHFRGN